MIHVSKEHKQSMDKMASTALYIDFHPKWSK